MNKKFYFNILTFPYPEEEEQTVHFGKHAVNVSTPLKTETKFENWNLLRKHYNEAIKNYFRFDVGLPVKTGFITESHIWLLAPELCNNEFDIYHKFVLKVQFEYVSIYPELVVAYDGKSKVVKRTLAELRNTVSPLMYETVIVNNQVLSYEEFLNDTEASFQDAFPVLNGEIAAALNLPPLTNNKTQKRKNKYEEYRERIKYFYDTYLNTEAFKEIIPLHDKGFLEVPKHLVGQVPPESRILKFGKDKPGVTPKSDFRSKKAFMPVKDKIHLFFIYASKDEAVKDRLLSCFMNGCATYKGLLDYAEIYVHPDTEANICFKDDLDPLAEIELSLLFDFKPKTGVKYLAIYITPFSKEETRHQEEKVYAKVKEMLIKRRIAHQSVEPATVLKGYQDFQFCLTTMSVTILAKLGGIPWCLEADNKKDVIVGVGAFRHPDGVQYLGSAVSFDNSGQFKGFGYFMKHQTDKLAGMIADKVKEFVNNVGNPQRLIIHFYKKMNKEEIKPIEKALMDLKLPFKIPIYIVTINKTLASDIIAFDRSKNDGVLMPNSGTFVSIGNHKYLLFNNSYHHNEVFNLKEGTPLPVKLGIQCTDKKQLLNPAIIEELIDQVYQFSRLYWRSLSQQSLPITVLYPEMIAQVAPYFTGGIIPPEGTDNLWFL